MGRPVQRVAVVTGTAARPQTKNCNHYPQSPIPQPAGHTSGIPQSGSPVLWSTRQASCRPSR